jgi:transmembrane sensor
MDSNELKILAQKYMDGTATPEEKRLLDQWYDTVHYGATETVELNNPETEEGIRKRMFGNLNKQLFDKQPDKVQTTPVFKMQRFVKWVGSVAAVLALAYFAWSWHDQSTPVKALAIEKRLVKVPACGIIHITLPDGSKVFLNAGSIFKYPKSFKGKDRIVELVEGRAFFDIKHQSNHPFIVKTKTLNITVLGTSFDVRSYKKEGITRVSVVTGKVGVKNNGNGQVVMLLPKQQVVLSNLTLQQVKEPIRETEVNAWYKNNFDFDQESLGDVFKVLEKEYNTKIIVDNQDLLSEKITVHKLNNLQPLDTILQTLSFTKHFKYQMANDSTIVIR